ncbi:epoxyqueuosine reductase [Mycoplasmatota bacterium]|nr:epoxyqueuosine reductase [Mycoplasmatota bacterium]
MPGDVKREYTNLLNELIEEFYINYAESETPYEMPLIGFSSGSDKIFDFFKNDIGGFYWNPKEAFRHEFGDSNTDKLSVVSFIFPQRIETRIANLNEEHYASRLWSNNRIYGQKFIDMLMEFLVNELNRRNIKTMCPSLSENWSYYESDKYGYASSWSERHTAFACGLGTFGLCDGLITSVGKAHRCGSIISEVELTYSVRKYVSHHEYCLFYSDGTCNDCIRRCPVGAISEQGHDKLKCRAYQRNVIKPYTEKHYEVASSSCGLCQVGVACEFKIPA